MKQIVQNPLGIMRLQGSADLVQLISAARVPGRLLAMVYSFHLIFSNLSKKKVYLNF